MLFVVVVLAALAALVHVYIFVLETLRWEAPSTRAIFGTTECDAMVMKQLAANQGVYNLMLAIVTVVGIVLLWWVPTAGFALILAGAASMLAAAVYLVATDRRKLGAAATQGLFPLLTVVATLVALSVG